MSHLHTPLWIIHPPASLFKCIVCCKLYNQIKPSVCFFCISSVLQCLIINGSENEAMCRQVPLNPPQRRKHLTDFYSYLFILSLLQVLDSKSESRRPCCMVFFLVPACFVSGNREYEQFSTLSSVLTQTENKSGLDLSLNLLMLLIILCF